MAEAERKRLVVIDGKSVFYRGYYAMPNLSTKDGTPTGGVYGFAVMALEVIKRLKPDYVCVAWDKPKTNIRKRLEMYPEYKAGRKPAPPDFHEQVPLLHQLLQAFGWPLYELDDYEADDIMGTLAVQASAAGVDTLLVTSDMDMLQLVNGHVKVYALKTGLSHIELYSPESFTAKYGLDVHQFLDLKSLKGDSSDNIPGVPGIGEKTAVELLQQYKTLDGVYDNLPLLRDSVRKKLEAGKDLAYLSKKLAAIWTDAPIKLDLASMDGSGSRPDVIENLFNQFEFRTLARQLPEVMQSAAAHDKQTTRATGFKPRSLKTLDKPEQLKQLKADQYYYVYAEYADASHNQLQQLALATDQADGFIISADQLADKAVQAALKASGVLTKTAVAYDSKAWLKTLWRHGLDGQGQIDVQVASFLLNSLYRDQSLAGLAREYLDVELEAEDSHDNDRLAAELTVVEHLWKVLDKQLQAIPKLHKLFDTIEMPMVPVLASMEYEGIELNVDYLNKFSGEVDKMVADLERAIYDQAGGFVFNISSPGQLAEVLFTRLKLPTAGVKRGRTGYSTAAAELDKLRGTHPIIDLITQYREVSKLKNTYIDTLPKMVDAQSRLHTTFNLTVAQTGRLSSTDPNLQNIPVRTDLGRRIRTAFVAGQGKKLVSADYSQFELRLAAVMANDTDLIDMFNRGADIHLATAAQVYGRSPEDVTKQMRRAAKVINFGIMYGMSPHGLSVAAGMTRDQATDFIERYKALRRPLFDYMDKIKEQARRDGYVETLFGRRRPMPDIHSSNFVVRQAAERAAINLPIQGTEADLMKLAMINVQKRLIKEYPDCKMLLQIHDSILVECPADKAEAIGELLRTTMAAVDELPVRLDVDVTSGDNWGEL